MTNYKLKTISKQKRIYLIRNQVGMLTKQSISEEYKDFFFDELLFDLARPWPLEIKDCKFYIGSWDR